jgi:hypothetical protein
MVVATKEEPPEEPVEEVVPEPEPEVPERVLGLADLCDAECPAQAFVRIKFNPVDGGQVLDFCGNHFSQYEELLRAIAEEIIDERGYINIKKEY